MGTRRLKLLIELALWAMGRRRRYRAEGESMLPGIEAGDYLLCRPLKPGKLPKVGALIIAKHPAHERVIVKRVSEVKGELLWLLSDNPVGSDSRSFGWVPRSALLGEVTAQVGRNTARSLP